MNLQTRRMMLMNTIAASTTLVAGAVAQAQEAQARSNLAVKALIVGRRRAGSTLAEHRHHIRQVHGELVLRYIAADPTNTPQRYVQNPVVDGQFRATAPASDALALGRDFVTQVWFPSIEALGRSRATPYFKQNIEPDEDNFVDKASVVFFPARERELFSAAPVGNGSWKLFHFIQRSSATDAAAFVKAWAAASADLRRLPGGAGVRRHVQNDILNRPGAPGLADGIDEFWLEDEASSRALLPAWQKHLTESLVKAGLAADGSLVALIAREDVVFAGRP